MPSTPIILDTQTIIDPSNPGEDSLILASMLNKNNEWIEAFNPQRMLHPETKKPMVVVLSSTVYPFTKPARVSKKAEHKPQEDYFAVFDPVPLASGSFASVHTMFNTLKKDPASEKSDLIVKRKPPERTRLVKTNSTLTVNDDNYRDALGALIKEHNIGQHVAHMGFRYATSVPDKKNGFLAMYKLPGTTLESILNNKNFKTRDRLVVSIKLLQAFEKQIIECKHPDKNDVYLIHGDIKPHNIFLDKDCNIKFIDFGLSNWSDTQIDPEKIAGTALFLDPLLIDSSRTPPSKVSDFYAVARVLLDVWGDRSGDYIDDLMGLLKARRANKFVGLFTGMDELAEEDKKQIEQVLKKCTEYEAKKRLDNVAEVIKVFETILQSYPEDKASTFASLFEDSNEQELNKKRASYREQKLLRLKLKAQKEQDSNIDIIRKELDKFKSVALKDWVHAIIQQVEASMEIIYAPHSVVVEAYNFVVIQLTLKLRIASLESTLSAKFKPVITEFKARHAAVYDDSSLEFDAACDEVKKLDAEVEKLEKTDQLVSKLKGNILPYDKSSPLNFDNFYEPEYEEFLPDLIQITGKIRVTTYGEEPLAQRMNALFDRIGQNTPEQRLSVQKDIQRYKTILNALYWTFMGFSNSPVYRLYKTLRLQALDDPNPFDEQFWKEFKTAADTIHDLAGQYPQLQDQLYILFEQRCTTLEAFKQLSPLLHRSQYLELLMMNRYKAVISLIIRDNNESSLSQFRTLVWDYLSCPQVNDEVEQKLLSQLIDLIPKKNLDLLHNFFNKFQPSNLNKDAGSSLQIGM